MGMGHHKWEFSDRGVSGDDLGAVDMHHGSSNHRIGSQPLQVRCTELQPLGAWHSHPLGCTMAFHTGLQTMVRSVGMKLHLQMYFSEVHHLDLLLLAIIS